MCRRDEREITNPQKIIEMNKFRFKVSTMLEQVEDDYIKFVGDNYGVNRDEFLKDFRAKLNLESHHISTVHAELI